MIPEFRAKKVDSDEYIVGLYSNTFFMCCGDNYGHYISHKKLNIFDREITTQEEIDVSTLAIHFPFMIDNDKNKLFASLKGKKGASKVLIKFNEDFSNDCVTVDEGSFIECFIKFEDGGLFFEEQDSTWYYLNDILNLDCEITEIGIEE